MKALFFIPSNRPEFFKKASKLNVGGYIFDLEDSISREDLSQSIKNIKDHISLFQEKKKFIRVDDEMSRKCMDETGNLDIDGFMIPKFESPEEFEYLITNFRGMKAIPLIETVTGFFNMKDILVNFLENIEAIAFGAEDYCQEIDCSDDSRSLLFAKMRILELARFLKVDAYDTIYPYVRNDEGFLKAIDESDRLGFNGKMLIHPNQVLAIENFNSDLKSDIEDIINEYEENMKKGITVSVINGRVIERNHISYYKKKLLEISGG